MGSPTFTAKIAKRFDATMPPQGLNIGQVARTAAQGGGLTLKAGTATVANTTTAITVTGLDAAWNGAMVFLTPAQANTYASVHWFGAVASGTLTITVDTDPGNAAGLAFNYLLVAYAALPS